MTRLTDSNELIKTMKRLSLIVEAVSDFNPRDALFDHEDLDSHGHLIRDGIKTARQCLRSVDYLSNQLIARQPEIMDQRYRVSNAKLDKICELNEKVSNISLLEYISSKHESSYLDKKDPFVALHLLRDHHRIKNSEDIKKFLLNIRASAEQYHRYQIYKDAIEKSLYKLEISQTYMRSVSNHNDADLLRTNISAKNRANNYNFSPEPI